MIVDVLKINSRLKNRHAVHRAADIFSANKQSDHQKIPLLQKEEREEKREGMRLMNTQVLPASVILRTRICYFKE